MLQDIIDEYDMENNFEYLLGRYILYLERDGKFKHSAPRAKINFKARLKKLHNDGETEGREYKKMNEWVKKQMYREQKITEKKSYEIAFANQQKLHTEIRKKYLELNKKLKTLAHDYNEESEFMKTSRAEDNALDEEHKISMKLTEMIHQRFNNLQKDYDILMNKYLREVDSDYSSDDDEPIQKIEY